MKRKAILIGTIAAIACIMLIIINPGNFFMVTVLRIIGHYRTPQIESSVSIKKYADDHSLYYDKLFLVSNRDSFDELASVGVNSVPTIQIFDKNKRLLKMAEQNDCTWALSEYFKKGHGKEMLATDSTTYNFVIERIMPVDVKTSLDTFDYYVINYWAKYLPKLSHQLFETTNNMKKSMKDNICFMYVSLDQQEKWE
ncbi:MAG TPA: hypothetical protein VMZ69_08855 [Saprospiraceae bacterium]|nr:hypothetical protein [Saprospiraceae bacterium]